ncbi:zinc finger protein 740 isoform X2 [Elephas maximus indicus]|uniref:zinc finger protein 740 isoform X2 n=1 Tax=Elephas maximus indicus TaxID=99487 RepID=UPI0021171CDE|nr:zinc finger protein 740 isoform X2 [Elephas maximus indicus]
MKEASLLACEGLAGVSLVPTAASKKMMLSQIANKQAENGERAGSPDVLRCSSQGHRKDSDKSRSRKDDDSLAEASHSKKTVKKVVVVEQNGSFQVKIPKNFICQHCFGAFRSSYHLKRHILIHTGEKPFECDICDMRFIQKYHLERHKRVHSGEKPYQCERCHQVRLICHPPTSTHKIFLDQGHSPLCLDKEPPGVPYPDRVSASEEVQLAVLMQLINGGGR